MSAELLDEIEALNSIYGEATLITAGADTDKTYILRLPGSAATTLRLRFSTAYPDEPPEVLGTHSAGEHARRGEANRDLGFFRDAVAAVYEPGQVCLFDAIEHFSSLVGEEGENDGAGEAVLSSGTASLKAEDVADDEAKALGPSDSGDAAPQWVLSDPVTESRSTFLARCCPCTSRSQAAASIAHLLATDKKVRAATHNITAWRIRGAPATTAGGSTTTTSFQDCDDDGETAAGGRLLHLMQLMDLWDVVVVVTRWYGGQKLGPRRFALINQVARDAFVRAGLVVEPQTQTGKKKTVHGR